MINSRFSTLLLFFSGSGLFLNSLFMLIAPRIWYHELPGAVPDFGPYNEHFIRDIACVQLVFALVATAGALRPKSRTDAIAILALFYGTHSVLHLFDTARGFVATDHYWMDLPLVHLPALVFVLLFAFERRWSIPAGEVLS